MITHDLHQDWLATASSLTSVDTVTQWRDDCSALAGCIDLDDVLAAIAANPDPCLGFLIARHQAGGDELAGRCVLQAMIGVLIKRTSRAVDPAATQGDLAAHMWMRIATYPLDRRPHSIAGNLAMDTWKWAVKEWRDERDGDIPVDSLSYHLDLLNDPSPAVLSSGAVEVIREAHRLGYLNAEACELLWTVYGDPALSSRETGEKLGISADAVRWRCSTTVRRNLRPHAAELRAALVAA